MLARTLGRTLDELAETMSAQEFGLHQADYADKPWGDLRVDLAGGVVASAIANVNRGKDTRAFTPLDFMPLAREPEAPEAAPKAAEFFRELGA